jgi:hypothetical protein
MSCFYQDPTTPEWYLIMYHRTLSSDVRGPNIGMSGASDASCEDRAKEKV